PSSLAGCRSGTACSLEVSPRGGLVGARDVRVRRLVVKLDAVGLPAADHLLLFGNRKRLPGGGVVRPLLQEQDRPARSGLTVGDQDEPGGLDQGRILCSIDEAGQVEIVPVGPAGGLCDNRRQAL